MAKISVLLFGPVDANCVGIGAILVLGFGFEPFSYLSVTVVHLTVEAQPKSHYSKLQR